MRDLFIGTSVPYAAKVGGGTIAGVWEINSLQVGAIAIVDSAGALIAANASSITSEYITVYTKTSTIKNSFPIYKGGFKYSKKAYTAPVAPIKYVGSDQPTSAGNYSLNLPSTLKVGDKVGIGIVDLSKPFEDTRRYKSYTYTVVSGDSLTGKGSNNVIVKLKAIIDADPLCPASVTLMEDGSNNVDGIKFTGKKAGSDFALYHLDGILQNADIVEYKMVNGKYASGSTTAVEVVTGSGTYEHILELYNATSSRDGNMRYIEKNDLLYKGISNLNASTTYTTYVLTTKVPNTDSLNVQNNPDLTLVIAVPSGQTGAGEIVTVLDALLALV